MGLFDLFKKGNKGEEVKKEFDGKVIAPISGNLMPLSEVPDEVFAQKMIGDGIAIEPTASGVMVAPASGRIEKIFDTNHAFSIVTPAGIEIFVHFGMDTVQLEGKGFERIAEEGAVVKAGDPIVEVDLKKLRAKYNMSTMLVVTNANTQTIQFIEPTTVKLGQSIIK